MYKRVFFLSVLFANAAMAQEVAISGKDFLSGAGDAKLAQIAREAAASGKAVVITAPKYWQDKAAAKVHAGAADVRVSTAEGFFENVVVRIDDAKPAKAKPAEAEKPVAAEADRAAEKATADKAANAKTAEKNAAEQTAADQAAAQRAAAERASERVAAERAAAERAQAERAAAERAAAEKAAADKANAERAAAQKVAAEKAAAEKAEADKLTASRKLMEKNLNEGRAAEGTLTPTQLQKDDQLFVDGPVRGVVRRFGARTQLYWLEGDLNLERAELVPNGPNRYRVSEPVLNVANPTLRGGSHGQSQVLSAKAPAANSDVRTTLQKQYSEGRAVDLTLAPSDLRHGDILYVGKDAALVVRRTGTSFERYWLVGDIDLHQTGLQQQAGAYHVLTDTIK